MHRGLIILVLVILLLSLAGNIGLLWLYGSTLPELAQLRQRMDQQSQQLDSLRQEREQLAGQVQALQGDITRLEEEKQALEEEKKALEEELAAYEGQSDFLEELDRLEAEVRSLRRLVPPEAVPRAFMPREQLRAFLEQQLAKEYPPQKAAREAQFLALWGLLDPDTDLYHLLLDVYTEQVVGFYDLDTDRLYLVGEESLGPLQRLVFVHEYVHAMQAQLFDLGEQSDAVADDSDRSLALEALAEGDASLAMEQYMLNHLDELLTPELLSQTMYVEVAEFEAAPPIVQDKLLFPYEAGTAFVRPRYEKRGWAGVDEVWADPPQSTEQILHPERYPDDAPLVVGLPELTATLGAGWQFMGEDTIGEFLLRQHLQLYLDSDQVEEAATGWGGDRYALYVHPASGRVCLVIRILWDDEDEADEFVAAYQDLADERYGLAGEGSQEDGMWWAGGPGLYLRQRGDTVLLILAPDQTVAEAVARRIR